jgi:hypothetical protein
MPPSGPLAGASGGKHERPIGARCFALAGFPRSRQPLGIDAYALIDTDFTDIIGNTTGVSTLGKVLNNSTAFVMNDPGTANGSNLITILAYNQGGTINPIIAGNTTFTTGTGPSCPNANFCKAILDFGSTKAAQGNIN